MRSFHLDVSIKHTWGQGRVILLRLHYFSIIRGCHAIITVTKNDTIYRIDIADNGTGIPRRDWKNIFRPGFSTKKYGWGLGLSLANRIIKDIHRGKLFVNESVLGEGSTISIILR